MRIGLSVRKIFLLAAVLLAAALPTGARAQTIDLDATRVPISPVDSAWRFHLGDNARWAQPEFDDSTWPTLQPQPIGPTGLSQAHGACLVPISSSRSGTHAIAGPGAAGHREELPAFQRWQADRAGRHPAARSCAQCHRRDPGLYPSRSLRFQCKRDHSRASSLAGSNCRRYEKQRARGQSLRRRP